MTLLQYRLMCYRIRREHRRKLYPDLEPSRGILRGVVIGAALWLALLCGWVVVARLWERI